MKQMIFQAEEFLKNNLFINSWKSVLSYFVRNCKCLLGIYKGYKGLKTKF